MEEIKRSNGQNLPALLDPFCGGGSIPLEAQRLGLEAHGNDLNPIPVLITKSLIEIPPKFAGQAPVNPVASSKFGASTGWIGTHGLALFLQVKDFKPLSRAFLQLLSKHDSCYVVRTHEAHGVATGLCGRDGLV